jgi:hypothetical protein
MSGTTGARRITAAASRTYATVTGRRAGVEPILGSTFVSVCATVLLAGLLMAIILAMRAEHPIPAYAIFGSGLFGAVFAAFLVGALHLAVTDSRRLKDGDD